MIVTFNVDVGVVEAASEVGDHTRELIWFNRARRVLRDLRPLLQAKHLHDAIVRADAASRINTHAVMKTSPRMTVQHVKASALTSPAALRKAQSAEEAEVLRLEALVEVERVVLFELAEVVLIFD